MLAKLAAVPYLRMVRNSFGGMFASCGRVLELLAEKPPAGFAGHVSRSLWLAAGLLFVAFGVIGALLPLMPTTIFLILAVGCFARSSPRLENWLLNHPSFGPTLRAWREDGAIGRRAKIMACSGMALGYALFWWSVRPSPAVDLIVAVAMAGCAAFVVTRPSPRHGKDSIEP